MNLKFTSQKLISNRGTRKKRGGPPSRFFHLAATHTTATARVYGLKDESRVNLGSLTKWTLLRVRSIAKPSCSFMYVRSRNGCL